MNIPEDKDKTAAIEAAKERHAHVEAECPKCGHKFWHKLEDAAKKVGEKIGETIGEVKFGGS